MYHYKNMGLTLILAGAALFAACGSVPKFTDVRDREWRLIEVQTEPEPVVFDRNRLVSEGFGDIFTLKFDGDQISGKGAPNRYFGPYELGNGKDRAITIKNVAATLMAPIREPEKLKEREFFIYLGNIYRWNINKGNLELSTKGENGEEAVMVFVIE